MVVMIKLSDLVVVVMKVRANCFLPLESSANEEVLNIHFDFNQ